MTGTYQSLAYNAFGVDASGIVDLYVPPSGFSWLLQSFRVQYATTLDDGSGNDRNLELIMAIGGGQQVVVAETKLLRDTEPIVLDLMQFLSNTGQFGISSPDSLRMRYSNPIAAGEHLRFSGYAIVAQDT